MKKKLYETLFIIINANVKKDINIIINANVKNIFWFYLHAFSNEKIKQSKI